MQKQQYPDPERASSPPAPAGIETAATVPSPIRGRAQPFTCTLGNQGEGDGFSLDRLGFRGTQEGRHACTHDARVLAHQTARAPPTLLRSSARACCCCALPCTRNRLDRFDTPTNIHRDESDRLRRPGPGRAGSTAAATTDVLSRRRRRRATDIHLQGEPARLMRTAPIHLIDDRSVLQPPGSRHGHATADATC